MYERIEDKIKCVEEWHTKISYLKAMSKPIIEGYIIEINEWKEQQYDNRFSDAIYQEPATTKERQRGV